jgi:hypothetical protein
MLRSLWTGLSLSLAFAVAGCTSTTTLVPVSSPGSTATSAPSATAMPVSQSAAFTLSTTGSPASNVLILPQAGGYTPTFTFSSGSLPSGVSVAETVTNTSPTAIAALTRERIAAETFSSEALVYLGLDFSASTTASGALTLQTSIPSSIVPSGDVLWLALYDPSTTAPVWQYGIAGPATVSGGAVTLTIPGGYPFTASAQNWLAIYALPAAYATPAPAAAALNVSPATLALSGTGSAGAKPITILEPNYRGYFAVSSANTSIATVSAPVLLGPAGTITVTPAGGGSTTITVGDQNGQSVTVAVGVTAGTVSIDGEIRK